MSSEAIVHDKRRRFFGANLDLLTLDETVSAVQRVIERGKPTQHGVVNVAKLVAMQTDDELRRAVNSCAVVNADGQGIVWGARRLGIAVPERVAGIDLFDRLIDLAAANNYRVYFLGATDEVVRLVIEALSGKYSGLQIAGHRNGYFNDADEADIAQKVRQSRADMVFVAISSPKKECFLERNLTAMNVPFAMGVGGTFDIIAGKTHRAPVWMQRTGLEWLYRLLNEPGRMWKRYLTSNAAYMKMLAKAAILGKENCDCD